jgi:hypothetical protein
MLLSSKSITSVFVPEFVGNPVDINILVAVEKVLFCFVLFCNRGDTSITAGSVRGSYAKPLSAGCRRYHLTHTRLGYDFVLGEISFSILQMQRRLRPDSNPRLEATYRHSQTLASYRSRYRGRVNLLTYLLYTYNNQC